MQVKSTFGPSFLEYEIAEIAILAKNQPLKLACGLEIQNFPIAYQTYGKLNSDASNAILICHALTGDQYVANKNPITGKDGWWSFMVGPRRAIDTDRFFVICSNVIGGCMGSFGPKEPQNGEVIVNNSNESTQNFTATKKPYGTEFPMLTISDMVRAQNLLLKHLGIERLYAVIGGSFGGMQVLSWCNLFPNQVQRAIAISTSYRHSPQNIAFHEVGRQAIMADPNWLGGNYLVHKKFPSNGLSLARMTAHITYLSENSLQRKFGRNLQNKSDSASPKSDFSFSFNRDFEVESYLHHQGGRFVERFDPNSYLYISRAVDYFDLESDYNGNLSAAFYEFAINREAKFCIISFSDDWLFPPSEARKLTKALIACGANVSSVAINSNGGHDSFLIPNPLFEQAIAGFLDSNIYPI